MVTDSWNNAAHFESITTSLIDAAALFPGLGQLFHPSYRKESERRLRASHQLVRRAILECDWEPLLEIRRAQGHLFALGAVPIEELIAISATFKNLLIPHVVEAFSQDAARLVSALQAIERYIELGLSTIVGGYLERPGVPDTEADTATPNGPTLH